MPTTQTRTFTMTPSLSGELRRFAALKDGGSKEGKVLRGVVFDVDGTLCLQQNYMFTEMRRVLDIHKSTDILDHIHSLPEPSQSQAQESIRAIERKAMASQEPQPGLVPLMSYLESRSLPKGICTRNFDAPVAHLLSKFLKGKVFEPIITREFKPPKPDPAGILHIAKSWGLVNGDGEGDARDLIMVGDSVDDMTAGYRAGAATVLLVNEQNAHLAEHEHTDLCISRLDELIEVLEDGFVGRIGREDKESDLKGRAEEVLRSGKGE
ncbi:HAD-like domain-containing protein [Amylocarpus encephaloides]|uniref:HAD-like domain-containing protein n=1 Tax=Amylocarpus encephaloides TaxID=45428 RepID=A0A9P8C951_9HELO|nr:HAD-like domain-containing protein [Amylocarpus encephaloides]